MTTGTNYVITYLVKLSLFSRQFCLAKVEKEQYEKEQPDAQQNILKKAAVGLPVYTRTGTGGENTIQSTHSWNTHTLDLKLMMIEQVYWCVLHSRPVL